MWTQQPTTALYSEPTATQLKKQFAAALLRHPNNHFAAAREVEEYAGKAAWIAQHWPEDPIVIEERARIVAERGPIAKVPTKEEFAAEVYASANDAKNVTDKLRVYEFFAKLMGYVDTGKGDGVNVNILNAPKIMNVPVVENDDVWQRIALNHQKELSSRHGA